MRRFRTSFLLVLLILFSFFPAYANIEDYVYKTDLNDYSRVRESKIDAVLDKDGVLHVKHTWVFDDNNSDGETEHYFPFNSSSVKFLNVYMDGAPLKKVDGDWNVDASFENKSGKWGIHEMGSTRELCFGITDRKLNTFVVEYIDEEPLQVTSDGYAFLNYGFINDNFRNNIGKILINVKVVENEVSRIYGFGFNGITYFNSNRDVSFESVDLDWSDANRGIFLLELKNNIYPQERSIKKGSRVDLYEESFTGSSYNLSGITENPVVVTRDDLKLKTEDEIRSMAGISYVESTKGNSSYDTEVIDHYDNNYYSPLRVMFRAFRPVIFFFILGIFLRKSGILAPKYKKFVTKEDKESYYRDEPRVYDELIPFLNSENLVGGRAAICAYFLTKWINEGRVEMEEIKKGSIFKKEVYQYKMIYDEKIESKLENKLYSFFLEVARDYKATTIFGNDVVDEKEKDSSNIFTTSDLDRLPTSMMKKFTEIFKDYLSLKSKKKLIEEGLTDDKGEVREDLKKDVKNHIGFKHFLKDFTLINEKEMKEVVIWDYYLELAALYGISEKLIKNLDTFDNVVIKSRYGTYYPYSYHHMYLISKSMNHSNFINPNSSSGSGSIGGGGGSSFGGGGGFSGGGSGGGSR